jgi:hypothetical protein
MASLTKETAMNDKYTETKIVDGKIQLKGASINYPYPKQYLVASMPGSDKVFWTREELDAHQ